MRIIEANSNMRSRVFLFLCPVTRGLPLPPDMVGGSATGIEQIGRVTELLRPARPSPAFGRPIPASGARVEMVAVVHLDCWRGHIFSDWRKEPKKSVRSQKANAPRGFDSQNRSFSCAICVTVFKKHRI